MSGNGRTLFRSGPLIRRGSCRRCRDGRRFRPNLDVAQLARVVAQAQTREAAARHRFAKSAVVARHRIAVVTLLAPMPRERLGTVARRLFAAAHALEFRGMNILLI